MWVRKRIDIGWLDLLSAAANGLLPGSRSAAAEAVEAAWSADGRGFACLSVRTGFDLVLSALALPAGSEVLISALTIPDMARIIKEHGLTPVPIDLHPGDVSPQAELLETLVTPRTKVLLIAHLLGGRFDPTPYLEFARRHRLVVLEDCAQAFDGNRYRGHVDADVSMFSFGPIKTATALGGGLFRVNDESLLKRLRELQAKYPVQSRWSYLRRVLFYALLHVLGGRIVFGLFFQTCRLFGRDPDQALNGSVRNFPQAEFFQSLRTQPSLPLLKLLKRRITRYRTDDLDPRAARGRLLASLLPAGCCPGGNANPHTFWVFPVQVANPSAVIAALREAGFDATASNSLRPIEPPPDRPELQPRVACDLLSSAIYLPVYAAIPESEIRRMAAVCVSFASAPHHKISSHALP